MAYTIALHSGRGDLEEEAERLLELAMHLEGDADALRAESADLENQGYELLAAFEMSRALAQTVLARLNAAELSPAPQSMDVHRLERALASEDLRQERTWAELERVWAESRRVLAQADRKSAQAASVRRSAEVLLRAVAQAAG